MPLPPPIDILWVVLEHMQEDKAGISALCRVSRAFKEVAESVLYRHIELPLPAITPVCMALAAHPHLALHVRHFETRKRPGWKPRDTADLQHMRGALRRMLHLRVLRIHFSGPLAWILEGCHFAELRSLLCNLSCDFHLASFFQRQTELEDVTLASIHTKHVPCFVDDACLPNLTRISADPVWLTMLVPKHPVTDIDVWDFRDGLGAAVEPSLEEIDWLSLSLNSVTTLSVSELFLAKRHSRRVSSLVPHLKHLKVKCNTPDLFSDEEIEKRLDFTVWMSWNLRHFQVLEICEVIVQGRHSPIDIEETLMRQFVVDASEGTFDLYDFIVTFLGSQFRTDTKFTWRRDHEEWFRIPSGDNAG